MRTDLRLREDRKRAALSLALTVAIYLMVLLGFWITGLLRLEELSDVAGPVKVHLTTRGQQESPASPPRPLETPPPPSPAPTPLPTQPPAATPTSAPTTPPVPPTTRPAATTTPSTPPSPTPAVITGREEGNTYTLGFSEAAGKVGRSIYVPIYLYMPLPSQLPRFVGENMVKDLRSKALFLRYYQEAGGAFSLVEQPPLDDRPDLWDALKGAGYDIGQAEYRHRPGLRPVTIQFSVDSHTRGSTLLAVTLVSSSGYSDIDEAVLYGFSRATFFNNTERPIKGSFTYRF
ncbi:hypothetical protein [Spirochaeta thermophila]|uniref:Uncharacterized protein n=1 Tax=Winmispira thermophila (strain ATCC 49972 / DSM 6192 / RI 19.B1) TaxID=665571 RepID=E0RS98_WINT6|nr:hypothetical protein [Spirochaeta thermophila]ADN01885.1 hypothetical protein STHERM_c09380 [Spirochaeta thermophila DSM 6192]